MKKRKLCLLTASLLFSTFLTTIQTVDANQLKSKKNLRLIFVVSSFLFSVLVFQSQQTSRIDHLTRVHGSIINNRDETHPSRDWWCPVLVNYFI